MAARGRMGVWASVPCGKDIQKRPHEGALDCHWTAGWEAVSSHPKLRWIHTCSSGKEAAMAVAEMTLAGFNQNTNGVFLCFI